MSIWKEGFENTKILRVNTDVFLQGCKNCDKIVNVTNAFINRQLVGNVYQSLCNCENCGSYIVIDECNFKYMNLFIGTK